jgi:glutathione S-transferase
MTARLYWFPMSHPAQAARKMLELKGVPYEATTLIVGFQPVVRLLGFPGVTVPALAIDGRKILGSRAIARELDRIEPEPPLFPRDPAARAKVEEAERWGDEVLQSVPRRAFRWGLTQDNDLRAWLAGSAGVPGATVVARLSAPQAVVFARMVGTGEARVRADLAALPAMLDRVDAWLADGTLALDTPNAATLQVLASVAAILNLTDYAPLVEGRPCAEPARTMFPGLPGPVPAFLPPEMRPAAT